MIPAQRTAGVIVRVIRGLALVFLLSSNAASSAAEISSANDGSSSRDLEAEDCQSGGQRHPPSEGGRSQADDRGGQEIIRVGEAPKDDVALPPSLDHGPEHPYTYYNLARADCASDRTLQAIYHLSLALERDPKFAAAYHFRGLLHFRDREFESALADLNETLELQPDNTHAELFRDRAALCLRGKYHCDEMEGTACTWQLHARGLSGVTGGRTSFSRGVPGYIFE